MIKNLKLKEIFNSALKMHLIKNYYNENNFISFWKFYLTTDRYLPICSEFFFNFNRFIWFL